MSEPGPAKVARACAIFLLPFLVLYTLVVGYEKRWGFAPAAAQVSTTSTVIRTTTTLPVPVSTTTTTTRPTDTTAEPTTTVSIIDFPNPPNASPTSRNVPGTTAGGGVRQSNNCHEESPGVGILYRCNGARWICKPKVATPGTYCIDP